MSLRCKCKTNDVPLITNGLFDVIKIYLYIFLVFGISIGLMLSYSAQPLNTH
jgi:hypothetical protein